MVFPKNHACDTRLCFCFPLQENLEKRILDGMVQLLWCGQIPFGFFGLTIGMAVTMEIPTETRVSAENKASD